MDLPEAITRAAHLIGQCRRLVALTGAGVSQESSVPTFRDAMDGLWVRYDPQELATPEAFRRNPRLVWDWYEYRREMVRQASPNPGHRALAALEDLVPQVVIVTQNVDDLHQRAGSRDIIPLHGALMRNRCFANCQGDPTIIDVSSLEGYDPESGPPRCPFCGEWVRPDVVWFGESLSHQNLQQAIDVCERAEVVLGVGTSGVVQPAASLPYVARRAGATLIEVNPQQSGITLLADLWLAGPSGEVLPGVVAAIREAREGGVPSGEA